MKSNNPDSVLSILQTVARGKENAISVYDLSKLLYCDPRRDDRRIRIACDILRNERNEMIYSCNKGLFIAVKSSDIDEYIARQTSQLRGIRRNIDKAEMHKRSLQQQEGELPIAPPFDRIDHTKTLGAVSERIAALGTAAAEHRAKYEKDIFNLGEQMSLFDSEHDEEKRKKVKQPWEYE